MKKHITRFLAIVLSLTLLISVCPLNIFASNESNIVSDDFNNADNSANIWESIKISDNTVSDKNPTVSNGKLAAPDDNTVLVTLNSSIWNEKINEEGRKIEKFTTRINLSNNASRSDSSKVVLYYNPTTSNNIALAFNPHSTYGWQIGYQINGEAINNNFIADNATTTTATKLPTFPNGCFIELEATYQFSQEGILSDIVCVVKFYTDSDFTSLSATITSTMTFKNAVTNNDIYYKSDVIEEKEIENILSNFKVGFLGSSGNTAVEYEEAQIAFSLSSADKVTAFKTKFQEILAKTENEISYSDIPEISSALNEMNGLGTDACQELAEERTKLLSLYKKVIADKYGEIDCTYDNFENYSSAEHFSDIWNTYSLGEQGAVSSAAQIVDKNASKQFKPAVSSENKQFITAYSDGVWNYKPVEKINFDLLIPDSAYTTAEGSQHIIAFYEPISKNYIGYNFLVNKQEGYIQAAVSFSEGITRGNGYTQSRLLFSDGWTNSKPLECELIYEYVDEKSVKISLNFKQGNLTNSKISHAFSVNGTTSLPQFKIGFASVSSEDYACYFDNLSIDFVKNDDDYANIFLNNHSAILDKAVNSITANDTNALIAALEEYWSLSSESQSFLPGVYYKLVERVAALNPKVLSLKEKYNDVFVLEPSDITDHSRDERIDLALSELINTSNTEELFVALDLYRFVRILKSKSINILEQVDYGNDGEANVSINFENGYNPFRSEEKIRESIYTLEADPVDENNTSLKIQGGKTESMFLTLDELLWPEHHQIKSLSFRMFIVEEGYTTNTPQIAFDYFDEYNYRTISMSAKNNKYDYDVSRMRVTSIVDGESSTVYFSKTATSDWSDWIDISITFDEQLASVSAYYRGNKYSTGTTTAYNAGAKIALMIPAKSGVVYLDDFNIVSEYGDYDIDDTIEDVNIYYSMNSFTSPDETVLVYGEQLGTLVNSVKAHRLDDTAVDATSTPKYIEESKHDSAGVEENIEVAPTTPIFDDSIAISSDILQITKSSIKFILPKDIGEKGIYSLKLQTPTGKSKVVYINNPEIRYVIADEGDIATKGGYIKIIGNNLVPTYNKDDVTVKLVNKENGQVVVLPVTKIYGDDSNEREDMYYLYIDLPEDIAEGEYLIFTHNGYGGETAWSMPKSIKIAPSPRDAWSKTVFNVKDFGAAGDGDKNDTAAVQRAMNAAFKNGGGVVYFPFGMYRMVHTITVPENVTIKGDGEGNTYLVWTASRWQYGECPTLLSLVSDVEIRDLTIHANRTGANVLTNDAEKANNIYIFNVRIRNLWTEGLPTAGGNGYSSVEGTTAIEVYAKVVAERDINMISVYFNKNFQMDNASVISPNKAGAPIAGNTVNSEGKYSQVTNCYFFCGWSFIATGNYNILENCEFEQTHCGTEGSYMYIARNYFHNVMTNNRELYTTDGAPRLLDGTVQKIEDGGKNVTYRLLGAKSAAQYIGIYLAVTNGQGVGQVRRIVSAGEDGLFTVESPFAIAPNRNSKITIERNRNSWVFSNNLFEEGNAGATYGAMMDAVYHGNIFRDCAGPALTAHGTIWYNTFTEFECYNPLYVHGEGVGGVSGSYQTGQSRIRLYAQVARTHNYMIGIVMKNNDFNQYYMVTTHGSTASNALTDVIIEGNKIYDAPYFIQGFNNASAVNGVFIRNNDVDVDTLFDSDYLFEAAFSETNSCESVLNRQGSSKFMVYLINDIVSSIGDVNLDMRISVKDVTLIHYYVLGMIELNEQQLINADYNADSKISLKDANALRRYIVYGRKNDDEDDNSSSTPSEPPEITDDDFFGGAW